MTAIKCQYYHPEECKVEYRIAKFEKHSQITPGIIALSLSVHI